MKFVSDPDIAVKIARMKRRVRWQEPLIQEQKINQTKLIVDDGKVNCSDFSFLVIGDSGCGYHLKHHPQRKIAEMMLAHHQESSFILHTGDLVYQVGSDEYYHNNFIDPYRELLVGGEAPKQLQYDLLTFKLPFFPVPGNHDYYNLPLVYGILAQATWLPRRLLRGKIDLDVGWHGSDCGNAYAKAFLDYSLDIKDRANLVKHFETHYHKDAFGDRCLRYKPGQFTRLPNRYYTFRYGEIDFFALDSNTFNQPLAIPDTEAGRTRREQLLSRRQKLADLEQKTRNTIDRLNPRDPESEEKIDDCHSKLEHIAESQRDIEKQLNNQQQTTDWEQLEWLKASLVASWQDKAVKGRVIFLHHPPYVTERTKWNQGQTLAVRDRLRQVFNSAAQEIGEFPPEKSLVNLVISGHAHCLEHLYTENTGYADSYTNWLVCGGSGHSLRRQRSEGTLLYENADITSTPIGRSVLYLGRNGKGKNKKRPYSFLRIDVSTAQKVKFTVQPYVAQWQHHQWQEYAVSPFTF